MRMDVLIVDDSRAMRTLLSGQLEELGFRCDEADGGSCALEKLDGCEHAPRAILVDWNMPRMNGLELIGEIRARAALDAVPVVVVTSETGIEEMRAAVRAGANEYLIKPFSREELSERLMLAGVPPE